MRTSTAYFVGAGTVIAAIVVGLGGGLLMTNIVSRHSPSVANDGVRIPLVFHRPELHSRGRMVRQSGQWNYGRAQAGHLPDGA